MKRYLLITVGILLVAIFVPILFFFQVRQNQVAVVTTFAKATRDADPGPHLKWPWPIESVHKFDQRIHSLESLFAQVNTSDGRPLLLMVYVGWTIAEPKQFFPSFGDAVSKAEGTIKDQLSNVASGVAGRHPFAHFISTDEKELKFVEIEQEMLGRLRVEVNTNNYGIEIKFLGINKLGLPESVTEDVFNLMRKERALQAGKIEDEGTRLASDIRSAADLASAKVLTEADSQAKQILSEGEREAAKTFEVFKQEPELANFLLNLGALESFMKEKTVLILDTTTEPLKLLRGPNATSTNATPRSSQP